MTLTERHTHYKSQLDNFVLEVYRASQLNEDYSMLNKVTQLMALQESLLVDLIQKVEEMEKNKPA